jgi:hypothetical protein
MDELTAKLEDAITENEGLKSDFRRLTEENAYLKATVQEQEDKLVPLGAFAAATTVGIAEAVRRKHVAEAVVVHTQDIETLKKEVNILNEENRVLRQRNDLLIDENKVLSQKIGSLESQVQKLRIVINNMKSTLLLRDCMINFEYFICYDACLAAQVPPATFRKKYLCDFKRLKAEGIALPAWVSDEMQALIASIKDAGGGIAKADGPYTAKEVSAAIADSDDDDDDEALKAQLVTRLEEYYKKLGKEFGDKIKRR